MKKQIFILSGIAATLLMACGGHKQGAYNDNSFVDTGINRGVEQALVMAKTLIDDSLALPRSLDDEGNLVISNSHWWCSGFFPGSLWLLYEATGNDSLKQYAEIYTSRCEKEQYATDTHDLGFMMNCSYGNAYRLTSDTTYRDVLLQSARSLASRFHAVNGVIRSWDNKPKWQYPVIIDNMMNLELLETAAKYTGDTTFSYIARTHADNTIKNHFRSDYSSFHVVDYDSVAHTTTGYTHQGYADSSAWARGQAWGLYGYTMMYRFTHDPKYLDQARHIAHFIIEHPNMPEDGIPYWDFDAPGISDEPRDASAAAVMASALIELCGYVDGEDTEQFRDMGIRQLRTLSSPEYLAEPGTNGGFLLKHSVGNCPSGSEVDKPLTYADYYYLEGLLRYRDMLKAANN